mgnify:CR=1 FL=1|jgi:hypothetical protein
MEIIIEFLKYILPAAIVFFTAYFLIKQFIEDENKRRNTESEIKSKEKLIDLKISGKKIIDPIRLQAYERLVLFLERISVGSLVNRNNVSGMSAFQLQISLVKNIRDEFEHNLSQQLYVSSAAWNLVKNAKEEMIRLVNTAATRCNDNATSSEMAQILFQLSLEGDKAPVADALEFLKNEARQLF